MTVPDKLIADDEPNFLSQLIKFIENLCTFVENEDQGLNGAQKYSRFNYFWELLYKTADFYFNFPDYIDKVMSQLPALVKFVVENLHFVGIFQKKAVV